MSASVNAAVFDLELNTLTEILDSNMRSSLLQFTLHTDKHTHTHTYNTQYT